MQSLIFKLVWTVVLGVLLLFFAIPWGYFWFDIPFTGQAYRLGLDLQWGIELDYKVDLSQAEQEDDYSHERKESIIEWLKSIIDKRVESLNINDSIITSSSYAGEEHIIVQIPLKGNDSLQNSENIQRAKDAIGKVVKIEFKELRTEIEQEDIESRKILSEEIFTTLNTAPEDFSSETSRYKNTYENIAVWNIEDITTLFTQTWATVELWENNISKNIVEIDDGTQSGYLIYKFLWDEYEYILIGAQPSEWIAAQDSQGRELDDRYFTKASVQYNEAFQPMVELTFNQEWGKIFGELTSRLVGEPMAIFVGWELLTAPTINEPILSGKAVITGNYTPESASILATDINTWVVPAPIYLTSERTIDARLGQNSLEKIVFAGVIGFISILAFLSVIYRISGIIAAVTLFIYVVIILAVLKQFWIVLTLASIAWLVLSIGIAVDANIIIFERVKDELRRENNKEDALNDGFEKSFSAIWDANITGLIVSVILFIFGINMIKGFWFILALGIIVSLFCVYFISRVYLKSLAETPVSKDNFIWYKK